MASSKLGTRAFGIFIVLKVSRIVKQGRHHPLVNLPGRKMVSRFTSTVKEAGHGQKTTSDMF